MTDNNEALKNMPSNDKHESVIWSWFVRYEKEIRKALQADQWQDISTAPKDGTEILVACMFDDGRLNCCTNAMWVESNHNVGEYFWYDIEDYMDEPTHWKPLPEPPKEKEG